MPTVSDTRRLRVYRVTSMAGELSKEQAADIYQEKDGTLVVSGLWCDSLIASQEDIAIQAMSLSISPLEYLKLRLLRQPAVVVETIE